jgi:hypothetical protein
MKCLTLLTALLLAPLAALHAANIQANEASITSGTAAIDGSLDEAFWSQVSAQSDFTVFQTGRHIADTTFRLAHDDAWLYVGIECRHESLKFLQPTVEGHDRGAMKDESIEVFLAPRVTEPAYFYHYALSFGGARDERIITGPNVKEYWDVPWRSATRRTDHGWTAEIAVPLSLLRSGGGFHDLRINVARNRRLPVIDSQNVVISESRESSSWSPVKSSFHEQAAFRAVAGFPVGLEVRQVPLVGISKASAEMSDARVSLQNHGAAAAKVRLAMGTTRGEVLSLEPRQILETRLALQDPSPEQAELSLLDAATDEVLGTEVIENTSAWRPLTAFLDRNYYTSEVEAVIYYRVNPGAGLKLVARSSEGSELGSVSPVPVSGQLRVPLSDSITLQLQRAERVIFELKLPLRKLPPQPEAEWKIDQARRLVLNNGKPFVPFGMIMSGVRDDDEAAFEQLAAHGFNTFVVWNKTTPQGMANYQRLAAKHGLALVSCPDECAEPIHWDAHARFDGELLKQVRRITDSQNLTQLKNVLTLPVSLPERETIYGEFFHKNLDHMIAGVEAVKRAPNLAAHFIMDEPLPKEAFNQVKFGQEYFARVRQADGYHPIIVNYSSHIPEGADYTNWCDILVTDPYWHPPAGDEVRSTPNHVAKVAWMTRQRAEAARQPDWQILACPRWSRLYKRPLTADEIRCQTYLALIYRATGIVTFAYSNMREADWQTCQQIGKEISLLTPFIAGPEPSTDIRYDRAVLDVLESAPSFVESPFDPKAERYPDVHVGIFQNDQGQTILLAANARHHPVRCRFTFDQMTSAREVFGTQNMEIHDHGFSDTLEPYATRAWYLQSTGDPNAKALRVQQTVLKPDLMIVEPFLPGGLRKGRKNLLPNPSFEDTTAAGCADYCLMTTGATIHERGALFGKRCIQLTKTTTGGYEQLMLRCDPVSASAQTYTLSVYLKADRNGRDAWLRGMKMNAEKEHGEAIAIKLSTEWQRYSITGVIPANVSEASYEIRLREPGTIWVDGAQLELGATATEFEESADHSNPHRP